MTSNPGLNVRLVKVQKEGDELYLLHWDGKISLFSVKEMLSQRPNDELLNRTLVAKSDHDHDALPTWFCVKNSAVSYYTQSRIHLLEYKL